MPKVERSLWNRLGACDWAISRAVALDADRSILLFAANSLSRLGNWPLYPMIALAVVLLDRRQAIFILGCAATGIVLLHTMYPIMKHRVSRPRPMDVNNWFARSDAPLDRYSFPSGHVMTLSAALVPILTAAPKTWPVALCAWASMAWARMAIGHHYASDIVAGTMLGVGVSASLVHFIA